MNPTNPVPQPERLFTLAQIQAAGGFSRSTLYRLRHGGGLRVVTVSGLTRVRERDWLAFLDRHLSAPGEDNGSV
jgi:hypothetical protein